MRLKARTYLTYAGKEWGPGQLFDAIEKDAREMISRDEAYPFNLEDPSTRSSQGILDNLFPQQPK